MNELISVPTKELITILKHIELLLLCIAIFVVKIGVRTKSSDELTVLECLTEWTQYIAIAVVLVVAWTFYAQ